MNNIAIYIHIPFCLKKCYYCNFVSYCNMDYMIEKYVDAVCLEILKNSEILSQRKITSIYFGGGTPSYINSSYITKILNTLYLFMNKDDIASCEITIEMNPNSANLSKIEEYSKNGINRVSIGLQTTHDSILKIIGREHTYSDFENTLKNIKNTSIENVSIDLIYPLPNLTLEMFCETLEKVIFISKSYNIKHISIYNLELHEDTKLDFLIKSGYVMLADEDTEYKMKQTLEKVLEENGYNKYEISNFSKDEYYSKHNLNYWNQGEYLGFGVCSSSFLFGTRYSNITDIKKYVHNINNNISVIQNSEQMDKLSLMREYVILRLRLIDGIDIQKFRTRFGVNINDIFKNEINELTSLGLLENKPCKNITLTKRGFEVANLVWEKFI